MEIERKFLIKEKNKTYPSPFQIEELKKEIKNKGKKIDQYYLPIGILKEILKELEIKLRFLPNEFRLRKYGESFFITLKSKGKLKREEYEKRISKEVFEILVKLKEKSLEKVRLKKKYQNKVIEFDYLPKFSLITAEIEFNSVKEAKSFKTKMKEITEIKKYRSQNLAR
ncbi:MAG: hypothetical protein Q8O84_05435 [Nanoarchaeota archaeon]|nr:hypothetical protein [Nanoarchaeota archaeon]